MYNGLLPLCELLYTFSLLFVAQLFLFLTLSHSFCLFSFRGFSSICDSHHQIHIFFYSTTLVKCLKYSFIYKYKYTFFLVICMFFFPFHEFLSSAMSEKEIHGDMAMCQFTV